MGCRKGAAEGKAMGTLLNVSFKRVGGIRFLRIGRFFLSFGVSRAVPVIHPQREQYCEDDLADDMADTHYQLGES